MAEYIIDFNDPRFTIEPIEHNGEIVRCRDCAFFDDEGEFGQWCTQLDFGKKKIADGFCAWAERKVDE